MYVGVLEAVLYRGTQDLELQVDVARDRHELSVALASYDSMVRAREVVNLKCECLCIVIS